MPIIAVVVNTGDSPRNFPSFSIQIFCFTVLSLVRELSLVPQSKMLQNARAQCYEACIGLEYSLRMSALPLYGRLYDLRCSRSRNECFLL